jgi:hypothetical protein
MRIDAYVVVPKHATTCHVASTRSTGHGVMGPPCNLPAVVGCGLGTYEGDDVVSESPRMPPEESIASFDVGRGDYSAVLSVHRYFTFHVPLDLVTTASAARW